MASSFFPFHDLPVELCAAIRLHGDMFSRYALALTCKAELADYVPEPVPRDRGERMQAINAAIRANCAPLVACFTHGVPTHTMLRYADKVGTVDCMRPLLLKHWIRGMCPADYVRANNVPMLALLYDTWQAHRKPMDTFWTGDMFMVALSLPEPAPPLVDWLLTHGCPMHYRALYKAAGQCDTLLFQRLLAYPHGPKHIGDMKDLLQCAIWERQTTNALLLLAHGARADESHVEYAVARRNLTLLQAFRRHGYVWPAQEHVNWHLGKRDYFAYAMDNNLHAIGKWLFDERYPPAMVAFNAASVVDPELAAVSEMLGLGHAK